MKKTRNEGFKGLPIILKAPLATKSVGNHIQGKAGNDDNEPYINFIRHAFKSFFRYDLPAFKSGGSLVAWEGILYFHTNKKHNNPRLLVLRSYGTFDTYKRIGRNPWAWFLLF